MSNPRALYYLHGRRHRIAEAEANPDLLGLNATSTSAAAPTASCGRRAGAVAGAAARAGRGGLAGIVSEYDQYSTREFLEVCGWSEGAIEMFGLLADQEA
jgi:monoamine oxidase